jgi:hypothetical protein
MEHKIYMTSAKYKDKNGITRRANHYNAEYNGRIILTSDDAECASARYLLNNKLAEETDIILTYMNNKPSLTGSVKWLAEHTVEETAKVGPRFIKWRPFDKEVVARVSPD